jgi:hypothetical protein
MAETRAIVWDGVICPPHEMKPGTDPNILVLAEMANDGHNEMADVIEWAMAQIAGFLGAASTHTRAMEAMREARRAINLLSGRLSYVMLNPGTYSAADANEACAPGDAALSRIDAILKEEP